jgi:hypothetical protein
MSIPERKSSSGSDRNSEKNHVGAIQAETEDIYTDDAIDPIYQAKARILNDALQEIGMGKYQVGSFFFRDIGCVYLTPMMQWFLFVVAGFGWFS